MFSASTRPPREVFVRLARDFHLCRHGARFDHVQAIVAVALTEQVFAALQGFPGEAVKQELYLFGLVDQLLEVLTYITAGGLVEVTAEH